MNSRRAVLVGFLVVLVLTLLVACGGKTSSSVTAVKEEPKTISVAMSQVNTTLDPHFYNQSANNAIRSLFFEPLIWNKEDEKGNTIFVPVLAESYSYSPDGKVWTFKLRKGVKFSNGDDFTSYDCMVTFKRLMDNKATLGFAYYFTDLERYEAPDDYTFIMHMKYPAATMEQYMTLIAILNGKVYDQYGEDYFTKQMLIGTGPWIFKEWVDGQYVRAVRNNNYWGSFRSYYDELYLRFITEESTGINALLAGDIKLYARAGGISKTSLPLLEGRDDIVPFSYASSAFLYFGLQCREGSIFHDIRAREAFSLAIDRKLISDTLVYGRPATNWAWFLPGTIGYDDSAPPLEYNPEKARQLLSQTNYKGEKIMLSSSGGVTSSAEILLAVSEMLNAVGFNTATQIIEPATLLEIRLSGNYDVFFVNGMTSFGDISSYLTVRYMHDQHKSNFKNESTNALIEASNREINPEKRKELLLQINRKMAADMVPQILLLQLYFIIPYYKGLTGFELVTSGNFFFNFITYDPKLAK